jgi:hypothetical protein
MTRRLKAVMHLELEYDARPESFGTDDVAEMCKIDRNVFEKYPEDFLDLIRDPKRAADAKVSVTVTPVDTEK